MEEEKRFDTEAILRESGRRLRETAELKRQLEKEEDGLQKEYRQLTQGKCWSFLRNLKRNSPALVCTWCTGWSGSERTALQRRRTGSWSAEIRFCPYALILPRREVEMLSGQNGAVFTSSPVPVVAREDLERDGRPGEAQ